MKAYFFALCLLAYGVGQAQSPRVPSKMKFADMTLRINDDARKEIQKDVDALTRSAHHYNLYVQRARTYFPMIEQVFREEGVPEDFKYLAIQESGLRPDAVSSSDAVGYWQFKDFTAREMGLRVDRNVDERMNIVSASRGAARYMKKNNTHFFDNWLISLQAYQMGPGAAIKAGGKKHAGEKSMTIDKKTYWYIKKYLAHKVAFENITDGTADLQIVAYTNGANKSFSDISRETGVSQRELEEFNKWLIRGKIPTDRTYAVILPVTTAATRTLASNDLPGGVPSRAVKGVNEAYSYEYAFAQPQKYPDFRNRTEALTGKVTKVNGLKAIVARRGDRAVGLATKGDVSVNRFYKYNDLKPGSELVEGQVYYLQKKNAKQPVFHHVTREGESLWDISQLYGIRFKNLKTRNRMRKDIRLRTNQIVWLRYIRPREIPVEYWKPEPEEVPVIVKQLPAKTEPVTGNSSEPRQVEAEQEMVFASNSSEAVILENESSEDVPEWPNSMSVKESGEKSKTNDPDIVETRDWDSGKKEIEHTVSSGETLYYISRKYDTDINEILEINNIEITEPLAIGQKLRISVVEVPASGKSSPPVNSVDKKEIYYTVQPGDTMYGISRKFDLSVDELRKLNEKDDYSVKSGEKLRVK